MQKPLPIPVIPDELYMLWMPGPEKYVRSIDEARGGPTYLVAFGEAEISAARDHQFRMYSIESIPVRIK